MKRRKPNQNRRLETSNASSTGAKGPVSLNGSSKVNPTAVVVKAVPVARSAAAVVAEAVAVEVKPSPKETLLPAAPTELVRASSGRLAVEEYRDPFADGPPTVRSKRAAEATTATHASALRQESDSLAPAEVSMRGSDDSLRPTTLDDDFFEAKHTHAAHDAAPGAEDDHGYDANHRIVRLASAEVSARRAAHRRVVTASLAGLALLVGLGGAVRAAFPDKAMANSMAPSAAAENRTVVDTTVVPAPLAVAAPLAQPAAELAAVPAPEAVVSPGVSSEDEVVAPTKTPAEVRAAATKAKQASQSALDRGDVKASIERGEEAVAADAQDAESWLILGAAYQQKGDGKNAARAFNACLKEGKRGPKNECAQMLRGGF